MAPDPGNVFDGGRPWPVACGGVGAGEVMLSSRSGEGKLAQIAIFPRKEDLSFGYPGSFEFQILGILRLAVDW